MASCGSDSTNYSIMYHKLHDLRLQEDEKSEGLLSLG
jgi:hypothetical protein